MRWQDLKKRKLNSRNQATERNVQTRQVSIDDRTSISISPEAAAALACLTRSCSSLSNVFWDGLGKTLLSDILPEFVSHEERNCFVVVVVLL